MCVNLYINKLFFYKKGASAKCIVQVNLRCPRRLTRLAIIEISAYIGPSRHVIHLVVKIKSRLSSAKAYMTFRSNR